MTTETVRLESIPISCVAVGENPRQRIDRESEAFKELVISIKQHGVITPVLLGPAIAETASHPLIAGNRRVAAAAAAGLAEIPAMIVDRPGVEFILAVTENVQREDLSAVEEAEALERLRQAPFNMKQVEAAQALGKSERWARERLRLLKLPPDARQAMNERLIPLEAAVHIERIAKGSTRAADVLVAQVREDTELGRDLIDINIVAARLRRIAKKAGLQPCSSSGIYDPGTLFDALPIPSEARERLQPLVDEIPQDPWTGRPASFRFDEKDADAARAYGCLLELAYDRYGVKDVDRYITDPEWLVDRVEQKIPEVKAEVEKRIEERESAGRRRGEGASQNRKELEATERKAAKAKKSNAALAESLLSMKAPKLDLLAAKLMAALCLEWIEETDGRVARAFGDIDPRYREVDEDGNSQFPGDHLLREIAEAKTPAAVFRTVFRLIAMEELALNAHPYMPHSIDKTRRGDHCDEPRFAEAGIDVQEMAAQIAEDMALLPDPIAKALKQCRAEKAAAAKKRKEEADNG